MELLTGFKQLSKQDSNKQFIEDLKEQNKNKDWKFSVIDINVKDGAIVTNAKDIKIEVDKLDVSLREQIETIDSVEDIEAYETTLKVIFDWLKGTRIKLTSPLDEIKSEFTSNEKKINDLFPIMRDKKEQLLEEVYKVRRLDIFKEIQTLEDEIVETYPNFELNLEVFEDFADIKKKLKTFDIGKSGLSAGAKKQIKEQFYLVVNPILEQIKLNEVKEREQKMLEIRLKDISTTGTIEALTESQTKVSALLDDVDVFFPNIKDSAKVQINTIINVIQGNIRTIEDNAKKDEAKILNDRKNLIRSEFEKPYGQMGLSLKDVAKIIEDFKAIDFSKYDDLSSFASDIVEMQLTNLNKIKYAIEMSSKAKVEAAAPVEVVRDPITKTNTYKLSAKDIETLNSITITAENQQMAKEIFIQRLSMHFQMSDLEEI